MHHIKGNGSYYVLRSYENLEKFREVKKKSEYKPRLEPTTLYFAHKSPNHYTTAVVAAANHYFIHFIMQLEMTGSG